MNGADARAGEHRRGRFRDHRHVDHHAVAAPDPPLLQQVREAAGLFVQLPIGEAVPLARLVRLEDDRGPVAVLGQVPVKAVDRQVQLAIGEPADAEVILIK